LSKQDKIEKSEERKTRAKMQTFARQYQRLSEKYDCAVQEDNMGNPMVVVANKDQYLDAYLDELLEKIGEKMRYFKLQRPLGGDMSRALLKSQDDKVYELLPMSEVGHIFSERGNPEKLYFKGELKEDGSLFIAMFTEGDW